MANYTKPYMFNIVLNSEMAYPTYGVNLTTNDKYYAFNWTNIPQGKYVMTWSYRGLEQSLATGNDSPQVFLTLGSTPSTYTANNTSGSVVSTYIGNLQTTTHINADLYYNANQYDNCPVFFECLPTNNMIHVQVMCANWVDPFMAGALQTEFLAEYVLTLHFEKRQ